MLKEKLNEWVERVVKASEYRKYGYPIDRAKMIEDVEKIISEEFDKPINYESTKNVLYRTIERRWS